MSGVGTEQIVKVSAPKWSYAFRVIMIIACVLAATTIPQTKAFGMLLFVIFVAFTFMLFEYFNSEYEYSIVDDSLSVDRIMSKTYRKHCGTYDLSKATLVTEVDTQAALKMEYLKLKTADYASGKSNEGVYVIYTYDVDSNEQIRIFIEPSDETLDILRTQCPCGITTDTEQ